MNTTPEISFRNVDPTPELRAAVAGHIKDLERIYSRIIGCHVMIERARRRRQTGDPVHVRIEVTVPGRDLVVSRPRSDQPRHVDPHLTLKDSFDEVARRLERYASELRGDVKKHEPASHGSISELTPDHGFIDVPGGQIVYFHPNSVVGIDFSNLSIGDEVRFSPGQGLEGPQATSVRRIGKPRIDAGAEEGTG